MEIKCEHWSECNINGGGCCAINKYGGKPSFGTCLTICNLNGIPDQFVFNGNITLHHQPEPQPKKSKGLGDTIKKLINKVTRGKVKQCGGCKKRQESLNKLMPYKEGKDAN